MPEAPLTLSPTLPTTGDVIDGKYVLERLLGRGGMGAVYAARHRKLGHAVAIKVMLADAANHEAASRFVNEGRAAANIQSEHVVKVSDVDEENGYAYMVLELLEGEDLAQVLERERRLPAGIAVSYAIQALAGVRQAHAQGIVHRDLKPSNLFLAKRNDGSRVIKVLDFGISKANSSNPLGAAPGALTSTKAMLGSPLYMSPEQLRSSKSVDARADIWAMGVIIYELCTGKLPFMGDNLGELFAQILEVEAPPLRMFAPDAPPHLEAIVAKCLQRRPEHRFQTAMELERELAPLAQVSGATIQSYASGQSPAAQTAMMTTPQNGYVQSQPAYDPRMQGTPPHQLQMTPQGGGLMGPPGNYGPPPQRMGTGSTTGSGVHPPVVKATTPLGASTPQPNALTDGAWQNTGSAVGVPSKTSATLVMVAVFGLLVVVGLGVAGYSLSHKGKTNAGDAPPPSGSVLATTPPPPPPLPPTSEPTASAAASATSTPSASASATAAASVEKPIVPVVPPHQNPNNGRPRPPEPPPPRPADPPVRPPPPPTKDPNVQQNSR